ncbi:mechanosensitive ion channel family protein [Novosphingobium sp. FKTRR1]|uniref:mechanosensitive ion channel family protein n=1 Tax=Novosphingobium sp. FKTRR1 TaxID=2879118 RepID=UPI001CF0C88B|nr:mechanosensitive ion channel domain-containing protein [Novosphingobium sp. FKTRR1]
MKLNPERTFRIASRDFVDWMDGTAIDVGRYHISLLTAARGVIVLAFILIAAFIVARIARRLIRRIGGIDPTQRLLSEKVATIIVWTLAFFIGVDALNISLTAFTVFSGAFGLAIGFGLQKTFGNLIAGLILLMDRSIKPGDVIAIADGKEHTFGEVRKIGVRAAIVTTRDNREYLIPNEILMTSQVENWTYSSRTVAISIPVHVTYTSDIAAAEALLLKAAREVPRVVAEPAPSVLLKAFGTASIELLVTVWISDPEHGVLGVRSAVLMAAWQAMQASETVAMPVPAPAGINLLDSAGIDKLAEALARRHKATGADEQADPAEGG